MNPEPLFSTPTFKEKEKGSEAILPLKENDKKYRISQSFHSFDDHSFPSGFMY